MRTGKKIWKLAVKVFLKNFAECLKGHSANQSLCRVLRFWHSANRCLCRVSKRAVLQRGRPRVHVCHGRKPFAECPALTLTLGKTKQKKLFAKCPTLNTRQNQMARPAVNRYGLFAECHMPDTRYILGLPSVYVLPSV